MMDSIIPMMTLETLKKTLEVMRVHFIEKALQQAKDSPHSSAYVESAITLINEHQVRDSVLAQDEHDNRKDALFADEIHDYVCGMAEEDPETWKRWKKEYPWMKGLTYHTDIDELDDYQSSCAKLLFLKYQEYIIEERLWKRENSL